MTAVPLCKAARIARLGIVLAISLLCAPMLAHAQVPPTIIPLDALTPKGGVTVGLPEIPGSPEIGIFVISGASFSPPGIPGEIDIVTGGEVSDRILFDNSVLVGGVGSATITFLSDDEAGNLFPHVPYPILFVTGEESTSTLLDLHDNSTGALLLLSVIIKSDP